MATADVAPANDRGFTLIELMTGIAILALLFLIGMPSFITFLRNSEIRSTSESIVNGLRAATAQATQLNSRVAFTLADANGSWLIRQTSDADVDCTNFSATVIQQFAATETRTGAQVTVTPGGQSTVCFNGLGRVFHQGTNDHMQLIDIATATAGEGRPLRIIVDDAIAPADPAKPRGLRMCDPDPALAALTPPDPRAC